MYKALPYFVLAASLLLAPACKDEPEEDFITESDIVGSWTIAEFDNTYQVTGTFGGEDLDESGVSKISDSNLQFEFNGNGSWRSTGEYRVTVTTDDEQQITDNNGIGSGNWSFRQDTLFLTGLINYNETGYFSEAQPLVLTSFAKDQYLNFDSRMDATEADEELNIALRTRADYRIVLQR